MNIFIFLLITLFYFLAIKPTIKTVEEYTNVSKNNMNFIYLFIYYILTYLTQFILNIYVITDKCGGSVAENTGYAGLITFFPWTFFFGITIIALEIAPKMKSLFADVIGYFFIKTSAGNLLTELLINPNVEQSLKLDGIVGIDKTNLQNTADTIMKIVGNTGILINQITPLNFNEYWNLLNPLMKPGIADNIENKNNLFQYVMTRDSIGEIMWYIYVGIFTASFVQYKIASRPCANNLKTMQNNYKTFLDQEAINKAKKEQAESTIYTISN